MEYYKSLCTQKKQGRNQERNNKVINVSFFIYYLSYLLKG